MSTDKSFDKNQVEAASQNLRGSSQARHATHPDERNDDSQTIKRNADSMLTQDEGELLSGKKPTFDTAVHSDAYEDIRAIPTSGYKRNPLVEAVDANEAMSRMSKPEIEKELHKKFKGIFGKNNFDACDSSKLPKLIADKMTPRGGGVGALPSDTKDHMKSTLSKLSESETKLQKKRQQSMRLRSEDPTMAKLATTKKQLRMNIDKAAAAIEKQKLNMSSVSSYGGLKLPSPHNGTHRNYDNTAAMTAAQSTSGQGIFHTHTGRPSNTDSVNAIRHPNETTGQLYRGATFQTLQAARLEADAGSGDDVTDNAGSIAEAQTKYRAQFRMKQASHVTDAMMNETAGTLDVTNNGPLGNSRSIQQSNFTQGLSFNATKLAGARHTQGSGLGPFYGDGDQSIPQSKTDLKYHVGLGLHTSAAIHERSHRSTIGPGHLKTMLNDTIHGANHFNMHARTMSRTQDYMGGFATAQKGLRSPPPPGSVYYVDANISAVREHKFSHMDPQREKIKAIHAFLMSRKQVSSGGNCMLGQIHKLISKKLRDQFFKPDKERPTELQQKEEQRVPGMLMTAEQQDVVDKDLAAARAVNSDLLELVNGLNTSFLDVIDSVSTYKPELAMTLQRLVESYNSVFIQQFECFHKMKLEKEKALDKEIAILMEKQSDTLHEKQILLKKQDLAEQAIATKQSENDRLMLQQQALEDQIDQLKAMLKNDQLKNEEQAADLSEKQAELDKKDWMDEDHQRKKRAALRQNPNSTKLLMDPSNVESFKDAAIVLTNRIEDRNFQAEDMYNLLKGMLANKRKEVKTQTEQACMNNAIMYQYDGNGDSTEEEVDSPGTKKGDEVNKSEDAKSAMDEKLKRLARQKGYNLDEEELQLTAKPRTSILRVDGGKTEEAPKGDASNSRHEQLSKHSSLDQSKKVLAEVASRASVNSKLESIKEHGGDEAGVAPQIDEPISSSLAKDAKVADFNYLEPPTNYQNMTTRQMGLRGQKKLEYLAKQFDKICEKIKRRKMFENNDDPTKLGKKDIWTIPYKVIAFIESRIMAFEADPSKVEKYELLEWDYVKNVFFEIYDHRIKYAPELAGTVNTNYVALNEHILIYFVDKYRNRKKAEEKIVDLFINLRYYYEYWQRAKIFANNLQLVSMEQDNSLLEYRKHQLKISDDSEHDEYGDEKFFEQPHAFLKDGEVSDNDIYCQEFFLHAYSLLCADRSQFNESTEGLTYVRTKHHDMVAKKIIPLIRGPCGDMQKWTFKMRRINNKIKNKDGNTVDYLDIDLVLGMMIEEYKSQRRLYQADIRKTFLRVVESNAGNVDLDQYIEVIQGGVPPDEGNGTNLVSPLMQYPGKVSIVRAFVFCCLTGEPNSDYFTDDEALAGAFRYALDNPVPTVSTRCALYGNSRDVMAMLAEAEKEYGKHNIKVDTKAFASYTMGLPEQKDFKKRKSIIVRGSVTASTDGTVSGDEQEEAARRRRPQVNAHETKKPKYADVNRVMAGIHNMKLEFVQNLQAARGGAPIEPDAQLIAGMKFKISSLQKKATLAQNEKLDVRDHQKRQQESTLQDRLDGDQPINEKKKVKLTQSQIGLSKKQIVVPHLETTAKVFNEHFLILRELKHKIDLLKQAYYGQMDKKKTWAQVDAIIDVLRIGCTYLDFPLDRDVQSFLSQADSDDIMGSGGGVSGASGSGPGSRLDEQRKTGGVSSSGRLFLAQAASLGSPRDLEIGARFGEKTAGSKKMAEVAEIAAAADDVIREEDEDEAGDRASTPGGNAMQEVEDDEENTGEAPVLGDEM